MADKNMEAQISVEFEEATSRQSLNSGETINTLWGKVKRWLSDLKAVAFSGSYIDLSDRPTTATTDTDGLMSAEDKSKLDDADNTYALKSKYGDTTIDVGRKEGTNVGIRSTAEGQDTTASNACSHAEGSNTVASAVCSHAEGAITVASGAYSHSEGDGTTASGVRSHAGGGSSVASGDYSFAHGKSIQALHDHEVALGQYNNSSSYTLFSIGDGTTDTNRHNAFEITTTGGKLHDKDIATTSAATQSTNGLMSAEDKKKLDGIASGANNYSLPTATSSVLGGVKIGSNISISSGIISISETNVTTALGYTPLSSISGVCTKGTTTSVDVTLGWKPSSVIIVDSNTPSSVYVPSAISSTGFSCGYLPEGTKRTYWAFK